MRLYLDNGYLNVGGILAQGVPFNFITGGRGIGKTYGALEYVKKHGKFIYLRRTQTQIDMVANPAFNPFKSLNADKGWNVGVKGISKNTFGFYDMLKDDNGDFFSTGDPCGYALALSTFSNLRGFDASDVDFLVFDEFIPERHEKAIRDEAEAFLNCVETINRNRELNGAEPLKVLALSNSNNLACAIFIYLGLVSKVVKMQEKGQECSIIPERGIGLYVVANSPISQAKKETALYKLTQGTAFQEMAISNEFADYDGSRIRSLNLKAVQPIVNVGELTICEVKGQDDFYATTRIIETSEQFGSDERSLKSFKLAYRWLYFAMINAQIWFENPTAKVLLEKYFE